MQSSLLRRSGLLLRTGFVRDGGADRDVRKDAFAAVVSLALAAIDAILAEVSPFT